MKTAVDMLETLEKDDLHCVSGGSGKDCLGDIGLGVGLGAVAGTVSPLLGGPGVGTAIGAVGFGVFAAGISAACHGRR